LNVGVALASHLKLLVLAAVLTEGAARVGAGLIPVCSARRIPALERFGLGLLLGWGSVGCAFLGLALVRLFYPWILMSCALALLLGTSGGWRSRRLVMAEAVQEARVVSRLGIMFLALAVLPVLPALFTPPFDHDSLLYHLGVPWQYLQAHMALLSQVSWTFHYPLPMEMTFALPLVLGDDRLAKWIAVSCFVAATAIFVSRCRRDKLQTVMWLGPLLTLSVGVVLWLLVRGKNDLMASSFFIAGALLTRTGAWTLGAVLLGLCVSAKMTYAPLVGIWVLVMVTAAPTGRPSSPGRDSRRFMFIPWQRLGWTAACLLLMLAPWGLKTYLATGNPVFPFASGWFSSYDWSAANESVLGASMGANYASPVKLSALPGAWFSHMSQEYLLVLLLIPALLLLRQTRRVAVACVLAQLVTLWANPAGARYLLPSVWLLALVAAQVTQALRGGLRPVVVVLLAGVSLLSVAFWKNDLAVGWRDTLLSRQDFLAHRLAAYEETVQTLARATGPGRLLSMGERLTYRLSGRVLYGGQLGETPLVWKLAKEAGSADHLKIKFRQLGATHMIYNYISAQWLTGRYPPFEWDQRMLKLYREYAIGHLGLLRKSVSTDYSVGGICVYRIRRHPDPPWHATTWFLPGVEQLYTAAGRFEAKERMPAALSACQEALVRLPDVGLAWNQVGRAYGLLKEDPDSYRYISEISAPRQVGGRNLEEYGEQVLSTILTQPQFANRLRTVLATLYVQRAKRMLDQRKLGSAEDYLQRAERHLGRVKAARGGYSKWVRRMTAALVKDLRGKLLRLRVESP